MQNTEGTGESHRPSLSRDISNQNMSSVRTHMDLKGQITESSYKTTSRRMNAKMKTESNSIRSSVIIEGVQGERSQERARMISDPNSHAMSTIKEESKIQDILEHIMDKGNYEDLGQIGHE